jgi:hypothetical protein
MRVPEQGMQRSVSREKPQKERYWRQFPLRLSPVSLSENLYFVFGATAPVFWGLVIGKYEVRTNVYQKWPFLLCCLPTRNNLLGSAASVFGRHVIFKGNEPSA